MAPSIPGFMPLPANKADNAEISSGPVSDSIRRVASDDGSLRVDLYEDDGTGAVPKFDVYISNLNDEVFYADVDGKVIFSEFKDAKRITYCFIEQGVLPAGLMILEVKIKFLAKQAIWKRYVIDVPDSPYHM